jgi:hypothetical protein
MKLTLLLLFALTAEARTSLQGQLANRSAWWLSDGSLRHHRYELELKHVSTVSRRLSTVLEGRARAETASLGFSGSVREEEEWEIQGRQAYLDYLDRNLRVRAGLQPVDWVESLSPAGNDVFVARDLRYGILGSNRDTLLPQLAADLNHQFLGGNLEWLLVPAATRSRLPKEENGYGFFETIRRRIAPLTASFTVAETPIALSEVEAGVRYSRSLGDVEASAFLFRGHQRTPSIRLSPSAGVVEVSFPSTWSMGLFASYAEDAWVARGLFYAEPDRGPRFAVAGPEVLEAGETLLRGGAGFDYLFSKHLKLYTELTLSRWSGYQRTLLGESRTTAVDTALSVRLTNETLRHWLFSVDALVAAPRTSFYLTPQATWDVRPYLSVSFGAVWVKSYSKESLLESLGETSQVFVLLRYLFTMG